MFEEKVILEGGVIQFNNVEVFDNIYKCYYHPLCLYASKLVGSNAEDIIENLFVKLWVKKQVFQDTNHLKNFLYLATRNACLDYLKTEKSFEEISILNDEKYSSLNHLANMIRSETFAEIYRTVNELPAQCAKVIQLGFFEGLTNQEIADEMNIAIKTVKNHKLRALGILKGKLSDNLFQIILTFL